MKSCTYLLVATCLSLVFVSSGRAETKIARLGVLLIEESQRESSRQFAPFLPALAEHGWVEGKNLSIEWRYARGPGLQFKESADELVRSKMDAIFAFSAPALRAVVAATSTIPIVGQDYTNDPITSGYAHSYAHPGKNITGVFLDAPEFAGKWIEMLTATVPRLKQIDVLWDPSPGPAHRDAVQRVAKSLNLAVRVHEVRLPEDLEKAFIAMRGRAKVLIILPSPMTQAQVARLAELTRKYRLPATAISATFAERGGAISYGPDNVESTKRNAAQVAKILGGARAGDIPLESPARFFFMINMKTVRELGLKVPDRLLLGADLVGK